jgi:hypothetical protein
MIAKLATAAKNNPAYFAARVIAYGIGILAVVMSATHIVHLFQSLGLVSWESYVTFLFIDGFAALGLIMRRPAMSPATRKLGAWFQYSAMTVSLVANVMSGTSVGGQVFGAMVVIGYVLAEIGIDKMGEAERTAAAEREAAAAAAARKAAIVAKGQATRAANKAKATAPRKLRVAN